MKSCAASGVRKMIVRLPDQTSTERCSSPGYEQCPSAKQYCSDVVVRSHCPFLQESLVQYCAAAPVVKYIPYTESILSRCGSGQHASCGLYAAMAGAGGGPTRPDPSRQDSAGHETARTGVSTPALAGEGSPAASASFPGKLWYTANHMWLEVGPEFAWRIGVDAFFAGLFGGLDRIEFPVKRGYSLPEAVFTSGGTGFRMSFTRPLMITGFNMSLFTNPSKLLADPYTAGWLFRGVDLGVEPAGCRPAITEGLIAGTEAGPWIESEERRMTGFVHDLRHRVEGILTMADGGRYQDKIFGLLDERQRGELADQFFRSGAVRSRFDAPSRSRRDGTSIHNERR